MNNNITEFLQTRIDANDFPAAVYLVAEGREIVFLDALGFSVVEPEKIHAEIETIYDLASLTKPLITGLLCAKLIETGVIHLSDPISKYFDEFDSAEKRSITIENLLIHNSGFRAWKPFYLLGKSRGEILQLVANETLENPINSKVVYSDLNYLTLMFLLEKLHGKRIDEIAKTEIFEPLTLRKTFYNPPTYLKHEIAASEFGNEYEKNTCIDLGFKIPIPNFQFRHRQIWGEVHDGNCYFMNGVSGHAGLFSTAEETFKIARQFLAQETSILKPETCELFRRNFTPGLNEARSLGFQLAETKDSTASLALAGDSFGHLGFTGTSLWIEPESERIFILLTNRTHAHPLPFVNINSTRRKFHELATELLNN